MVDLQIEIHGLKKNPLQGHDFLPWRFAELGEFDFVKLISRVLDQIFAFLWRFLHLTS